MKVYWISLNMNNSKREGFEQCDGTNLLSVNNRIKEITGLCTYIIDTHEVRKKQRNRWWGVQVSFYGSQARWIPICSRVQCLNHEWPHGVNWNDLNMKPLRTLGVSRWIRQDAQERPHRIRWWTDWEIDVTKVIIAKYMKEVSDLTHSWLSCLSEHSHSIHKNPRLTPCLPLIRKSGNLKTLTKSENH